MEGGKDFDKAALSSSSAVQDVRIGFYCAGLEEDASGRKFLCVGSSVDTHTVGLRPAPRGEICICAQMKTDKENRDEAICCATSGKPGASQPGCFGAVWGLPESPAQRRT